MNAYNDALAAYTAAFEAMTAADEANDAAYEEFKAAVDAGDQDASEQSGERYLETMRTLRNCLDTLVARIYPLTKAVTDAASQGLGEAAAVASLKDDLVAKRRLMDLAHEGIEQAVRELCDAGFELEDHEDTVRMGLEAQISDLHMALLISQTDNHLLRLAQPQP